MASVPAQAPAAWTEPRPKPTATSSGYATLAATLADSLLTEQDPQLLKKELAQLLAEASIRVVRCQSIESSDPLVRRIAADASESGTALMNSYLRLDEMAQDDGFTGLMTVMLGMVAGEPMMITTGASDLLAQGSAVQQERVNWASAFNRNRAAQLMLPEAAKAYAGPDIPGGGLLRVDLDESFAGSADHDLLTLVNSSGSTLTDCTVRVELRGRDGEVRQNIHYVQSWNEGGMRFARYGIGIESGGVVYGRQTVYEVQEARVSVWANEASQEAIVYAYDHGEKGKDVRRILDGRMLVKYRYEPPSLLESSARVLLVLTGVPSIPASRVTLTLYPQGKPSSADAVRLAWDLTEWQENEARWLQLGDQVSFQPEAMDISVTLPGADYTYTRPVTIQSE